MGEGPKSPDQESPKGPIEQYYIDKAQNSKDPKEEEDISGEPPIDKLLGAFQKSPPKGPIAQYYSDKRDYAPSQDQETSRPGDAPLDDMLDALQRRPVPGAPKTPPPTPHTGKK
jgi:hypothetical protein